MLAEVKKIRRQVVPALTALNREKWNLVEEETANRAIFAARGHESP